MTDQTKAQNAELVELCLDHAHYMETYNADFIGNAAAIARCLRNAAAALSQPAGEPVAGLIGSGKLHAWLEPMTPGLRSEELRPFLCAALSSENGGTNVMAMLEAVLLSLNGQEVSIIIQRPSTALSKPAEADPWKESDALREQLTEARREILAQARNLAATRSELAALREMDAKRLRGAVELQTEARRKALEEAADAAGKKKEVVLLDADEDKQFWLGYGQGRADAEIEIRALQAQGKEGE